MLCALQFVDDVLDFTGSTLQLGKPALNDLRSGLATAPVIYAAEVRPVPLCWQGLGAACRDLGPSRAVAPAALRLRLAWALQEHPQLQPLILRKFRSAGDVELAQQLVLDSRGIQRAKDLAAEHALLAADAVRCSLLLLHISTCVLSVACIATSLMSGRCCRYGSCRQPPRSMPGCAGRRWLTSQSGCWPGRSRSTNTCQRTRC